MSKPMHPTRQGLLLSAAELLSQHPPDNLTVEMVPKRSGVSKGSFYYHFADFQDLIAHREKL